MSLGGSFPLATLSLLAGLVKGRGWWQLLEVISIRLGILSYHTGLFTQGSQVRGEVNLLAALSNNLNFLYCRIIVNK